MESPKKFLTSLSLAVAIGGAVYVAGCGDSDSSEGSDSKIASVVPADTPFYMEGAVRPSAEQAQAIKTIGADFPGGGDLGNLIVQKINEGISEEADAGPAPTFETDVDPWLGDRAGFYIPTFGADTDEAGDPDGGDDTEAVGVVEVTDEAKAEASLAKFAAADSKTETDSEVEGVKISVDSEGDATALDNGLLFAGTEDLVKQAIEAEKGDGDTLADDGDFGDAVDRVDGDSALAFLYVDTEKTIELSTQSEDSDTSPEDVHTFFEAAGIDDTKPFSMSVTPEGDEAHAIVASPVTGDGGDGATDQLANLPANSTVAFAIPGLGDKLGKGADAALDAAANDDGTSPEDAETQRGQLNRLLDLDPADLGQYVGDGGFFLTGSNFGDLQTGIVAEVTDPQKIGGAIENAKELANSGTGGAVKDIAIPGAETAFSVTTPDSPVPIEVAYDGKKLVIAGGNGAAAAALAPEQTLADSPQLADIGGSIDGADASVFVDTPGLLKLIVGTGGADDPDYGQAAPYLDALGQFAAGSTGVEDGYLISNAVLTFQKSTTPVPAAAPAAAAEGPSRTTIRIKPKK